MKIIFLFLGLSVTISTCAMENPQLDAINAKLYATKIKFNKTKDSPDFDTQEMRQEVEEIKQELTQNIDQSLERGEKIEQLAEKSKDLSNASQIFVKQSKNNPRKTRLLTYGGVTVGVAAATVLTYWLVKK